MYLSLPVMCGPDRIGIDSHMKPQKRQVFRVNGKDLEEMRFKCKLNEENIFPFTVILKSGIHFRPCITEKAFRVTASDEIGRPFELYENPEPERAFYDYGLNLVLREYFPAFF